MHKKDELARMFLEMDEDILGKMPEWFRLLRAAYLKRLGV